MIFFRDISFHLMKRKRYLYIVSHLQSELQISFPVTDRHKAFWL